ncbi:MULTISPECIES: hypothetical protein [unclassified Nonomuraea]
MEDRLAALRHRLVEVVTEAHQQAALAEERIASLDTLAETDIRAESAA